MFKVFLLMGAIFTSLLLIACNHNVSTSVPTATPVPTATAVPTAEPSRDTFRTLGPSGEKPTNYDQVTLSSADIQKIRAGNYKAAILLHTTADWTGAVIAGARSAFEALGIEVVAVTDAQFNAAKQKTDIETALALDPDIIITLVLDPVSGAAALRQAVDQGVKVVLLSNLPNDFKHQEDYAGIVTDDLFAMGNSVAEMIGDDLGGTGKVALMFHDANYYVTNQRDAAVKAVIERDYPNIEIVTERGIADPNNAEATASAILTQYPDVDAIYAPWDTIAESVVAAARAANNDVGIYTMDLGAANALDMVKGGNIKGVVADLPFVLGETLANMGGLSVIDKDTPAFVTVPAIKVNRNNIATEWERSLNRALPDDIKEELDSSGTFRTLGPSGEEPTNYDQVTLSSADIQKIRAGNYKAAILLHTTADWTGAVIAGARSAFEALGIEVVAVTDAQFNAAKQKTDIETALALDPDIIITLVLDPVSGASALRQAVDQGVKVVLLSNLPSNFEHKEDYASIVTDDLFAMGNSVAEMMGRDLGGRGKVALMFHDANYYVTNQRDAAVKAVLERDYPNIEIVANRGIADPSNAEATASAILTQYPDVDAIYAPWDTIAESVVAAARAANNDVGIYTMDLGAANALDMVKGGNIKGVVADLPFVLGETMANVGGLSVIDKDTPAFVTVPAIKVNRNNIVTEWKRSLNRELPDDIKEALR